MSYTKQSLNNNNMGSVIDCIQSLEKFNGKITGLSKLKSLLNTHNKTALAAKISSKKVSKKETMLNEIASIAGRGQLKQFLKNELSFEKYQNMVEQLETIEIITYSDLESAVEQQKLIKMCRADGKRILSGKQIKVIMFHILEKLNKLKMLKQQKQMENKPVDFELDLSVDTSSVSIKKVTIEQLKSKRINLSNLMKMMAEEKMEDESLKQDLAALDKQINDYYMNMSEEKMLQENINDLTDYMNTITDEDEKERVRAIINKYTNTLNGLDDIFGQNFEEQRAGNNVFGVDKNLENLITKYNKEFTAEDKKEEKSNFVQEQSKMIRRVIKHTIEMLDQKFNTHNNYNKALDFFKNKLQSQIKPEIFTKIINNSSIKGSKNQILFNTIVQVAKIFSMIYYMNNNKVDLSKIYENIKSFTENEANKGKSVLVKSMNKIGKYVGEYDGKVYVNVCENVTTVSKEDIIFQNTLIGKNIKVTKGPLKGIIGTVFAEKQDKVLMTKGTYGKNSFIVPSLSILRIPRDSFKLAEEQYKQSEEEELQTTYADLYAFNKNKCMDLYTLTKFNYFSAYNNDNNYKHFNALYDIALNLYNDLVSSESTGTDKLQSMKKEFLASKKQLVALKKAKKNKEFILLKKQLQSKQEEIKQLARTLKSATKINNKFTQEEGKLVNTSSVYDHYMPVVKKQRRKKFRATKAIVKSVVDTQVVNATNMLADLGL